MPVILDAATIAAKAQRVKRITCRMMICEKVRQP
jgi:hypothetical protein